MPACAPMRYALILLAACSGGKASVGGLDGSRAPIVNGSRAPQNLSLLDGQILAVGYLADDWGNPFCTGTLTAGRWVVTAQHCVWGMRPSEVWFGFGTHPSNPVALLEAVEIHEHPTIDFALVQLAEDARGAVPGVVPITMNRESLGATWDGRWVDAAGYGETYTSASGRFFASVQLVDWDSEIVTVDGHGEQGICYGDSGGPILWQDAPGAPPVIVGTEQWGDDSCVDRDYLTRVDVVAPWADSITAYETVPAPTRAEGAPPSGGKSAKGCASAGAGLWAALAGLVTCARLRLPRRDRR